MGHDPRSGLLTWAEIDVEALSSNIAYFRSRLPAGGRLQAVIKSNAYGHGLEEIARAASRSGVDCFGVHSAEEALHVARLDLGKPVLIEALEELLCIVLQRSPDVPEPRIGVA